MINIKVLSASKGDCIVLSYGREEKHYILIDGGQGKLCFRQLSDYVEKIIRSGEKIDVIVLTHIDSDHIDGIIRLLSQRMFDFTVIKEMWFDFGKNLKDILGIDSAVGKVNMYSHSTEMSWKQGADLEETIQQEGIKRRIVTKLEKICVGGAEIIVLSPSKEVLRTFAEQGEEFEKVTAEISMRDDYGKSVSELNQKEQEKHVTLTNKSSIAFLFKYEEKSILLLGDADPDEIVDSLIELGYSKTNRLKIDYCKIAHHASKHNTTNELIQMLDCSNYIISTQQTAQGRPSKECLSRIICNSENPVSFYCNYELNWDNVFTKEEFLKYRMSFFVIEEQGINAGED